MILCAEVHGQFIMKAAVAVVTAAAPTIPQAATVMAAEEDTFK
jgi:hypothetical protein